VFRRVTRYSAGAALDPRENRLTEVTAAVLEHVAAAALAMAQHLLSAGERQAATRELSAAEAARRSRLRRQIGSLIPARVRVDTQVPTYSGRYVDLEVVLRPSATSGERGVLLWVEVKHGADVHADQVDAYMSDIQSRYPSEDLERVVVLLGPRGWEPTQPVPEATLRTDWQAFARAFRQFATTVAEPEERWLADQYIRYLEEEGLSDPGALSVTSALTLMEYERAEDAAAGICEQADAYVKQHWGGHRDHAKARSGEPTYGLDFWATCEPRPTDAEAHPRWGASAFEWGLRYTPYLQYLEDARGSYAFIAGASVHLAKDELARRAGNEAWLARREADGFRRTWLDTYKLVRLRYPDELLIATTLEEQGRLLGEWVVESFRMLHGDPPDA
jgi:hypothetical protein